VLGFFQPGAPGGEGFLGAAGGPVVAPLVRLAQLLLQLGDGRAQLGHRALGPRQRLRVGPAPLGLFSLADRLLDAPQPRLQVLA
jgi:hypothetical protein